MQVGARANPSGPIGTTIERPTKSYAHKQSIGQFFLIYVGHRWAQCVVGLVGFLLLWAVGVEPIQ